jgi:hypothetical protein
MNNFFKYLFYGIIATVAVYLIYPYLLSDETKIRKTIKKTAERTQKKDIFRFMEYFDKAFTDDSGLGADEIKYIAVRIFQTYPQMVVSYGIKKIAVNAEGTAADVEMDLSVVITDKGQAVDLIEAARKTNAFMVKMEKKENRWVFLKSEKPQ